MVHGSISELSMVPLRVMGGGTDHVIVASAVAPASEAPEQTPPLRLRAKNGSGGNRPNDTECRTATFDRLQHLVNKLNAE